MRDGINTATPDAGMNGTPRQSDRIASLDFIRGVAVLGILAANIVAFGQPFSAYLWPDAFLVPHGDDGGWMWIAQFVVIDNKMRGLFTLLFGAGMMIFMENAWARGSNRWLQARRLGWLLMFGLVHFFLIWKGDILSGYALVGLIALLFMKMKATNQLVLGLIGYIAGALLYAAMMVPMHLVADTRFGESGPMAEMRSGLAQSVAETQTDDAVETTIIRAGDYGAYVAHNLADHRWDVAVNTLLFVLESLPLMLIGMALYRLGFFSIAPGSGKYRAAGVAALATGAILSLAIGLWAKQAGFTYYATLAAFVGLAPVPQLLMTVGLAVLLVQTAPGATGWLGQRLAAAGRSAFTNYLGTSLLMIAVFHGWGLGLYGQLSRLELYCIVLVAWAIMLLWSKPWLDRFRYGPLEWLWRCLTYGRIFAIKR